MVAFLSILRVFRNSLLIKKAILSLKGDIVFVKFTLLFFSGTLNKENAFGGRRDRREGDHAARGGVEILPIEDLSMGKIFISV